MHISATAIGNKTKQQNMAYCSFSNLSKFLDLVVMN